MAPTGAKDVKILCVRANICLSVICDIMVKEFKEFNVNSGKLKPKAVIKCY